MVTTISSIIVGKSPVASTSFTFLPAERNEVENQSGADGSTLISFTNPGSTNLFHGIVGVDALGKPMISASDLIAKPCPPFCPEKREAYAVAYP